MPHPAPDQPRTEPGLPPKAASPSEAPNPGPSAPDDTPPKPGVKGALFRALVDAGADPLVAYTADEQAESMVSESVAVQVQPILANIRHQFAGHGRKLDALTEGAVERDRKLDALTEAGAEYGRKLDTLAEGAVERDRKLDALTEAGAEYGRKLDTLAEGAIERDRKLDALTEGAIERDRKLDALAEDALGRDRKLDALAEGAVEFDRKLDAIVAEIRGLKEVIGVRVDAQEREMRLIWGALGVLLTVLTVVFGFLFTG